MKIEETGFNGLYVLEPRVFCDERGDFMETYNRDVLKKAGIEIEFVQDNQSYSKKGVVRGLHFQNEPYAQTKLVRVLSGVILDIVVDLRKKEKTFGQHFSMVLSAENRKQLLVPKGFAHGFCVISDSAHVLYKCDEFYHPGADGGILFKDPDLQIEWGILEHEMIISDKDKLYPTLKRAKFNF